MISAKMLATKRNGASLPREILNRDRDPSRLDIVVTGRSQNKPSNAVKRHSTPDGYQRFFRTLFGSSIEP
jgi:hypothetical protein